MNVYNFETYKGDTLSFGFALEFDDAPQRPYQIWMGVRKNLNGTQDAQIDLNTGIDFAYQERNTLYYRVRLEPMVLGSLDAGLYYYTLNINFNGNQQEQTDSFTILAGTIELKDVAHVRNF